MKLYVKENSNVEEIEVHILCQEREEQVNKIISILKTKHKTIFGKDIYQKTFQLTFNQILYLESVEKRSYAYTKEGVYEVNYKLYELEEILPDKYFIRISKSNIVNISKISSIEPEEGRRCVMQWVFIYCL